MSDSAIDVLAKRLKDSGNSVTTPRRLVFELLHGSEPLSMHELEERAGGRVDRASLYRTIALFIQLGLVRKIAIGWKYKVELSELFTHHHHHMTCTHCHAVIAIDEHELEDFIQSLAARHHFTISEHQIELQGLCKLCRSQNAQPSV